MTTLLMMSFIIFGVFAYLKLPVAALPRVDFPTIAVSASLPGANPETMASSVAAPLERAFATIPGIAQMTSRSSNGQTSITLQFDLDRPIDSAALDVQSQISATLRRLPPELPAPPSFRKVNPADAPILFLVLKSPVLPLAVTNDYAEQVFAQQISQIPGVAQVSIFGQQKYAVRIEADPDAAASSPGATGRPCDLMKSPKCSIPLRTTAPPHGLATSARSRSQFIASRTPTPSRWWTRFAIACRNIRRNYRNQ
jgi:HAE1 family hydrophobic/amphiphilic exporter-1